MVKFEEEQGEIVPQRENAIPLMMTGSNVSLRRLIHNNWEQIRRRVSRIRLQKVHSRRMKLDYIVPQYLELDLTRLPSSFRYLADTGLLEETIDSTNVIYYRIVQQKEIPRFPRQEGISSLVVFYQPNHSSPIIRANESYSTWIVPLNEDFTLIRRDSSSMYLLDEHLEVNFLLRTD